MYSCKRTGVNTAPEMHGQVGAGNSKIASCELSHASNHWLKTKRSIRKCYWSHEDLSWSALADDCAIAAH